MNVQIVQEVAGTLRRHRITITHEDEHNVVSTFNFEARLNSDKSYTLIGIVMPHGMVEFQELGQAVGYAIDLVRDETRCVW